MTRVQALVAAAGLTALVLISLVWWGRGAADAATVAATATAVPAATEHITVPAPADSTNSQQLMEENRQLRQAVELLLTREAEYQRQIEAANQRIQAASAPQTVEERSAYEDDDHEREHDDHEREEHEDEGHEREDHD